MSRNVWGPADVLLDEWELLRSDGVDLVTAAHRIGIRPDALDRALHRALERGDDRGRHRGGCNQARAWARRQRRLRALVAQEQTRLAQERSQELAAAVAASSRQNTQLAAVDRCACGAWSTDRPCSVCREVPTHALAQAG